MRTMDFTTEQPDCCQVGDYLEVEENQLRRGKVTKIWKDDRFNYITLEFDEEDVK